MLFQFIKYIVVGSTFLLCAYLLNAYIPPRLQNLQVSDGTGVGWTVVGFPIPYAISDDVWGGGYRLETTENEFLIKRAEWAFFVNIMVLLVAQIVFVWWIQKILSARATFRTAVGGKLAWLKLLILLLISALATKYFPTLIDAQTTSKGSPFSYNETPLSFLIWYPLDLLFWLVLQVFILKVIHALKR